MDVDEEMHWLFCGDEGSGKAIGPFETSEAAESDVAKTKCPHDHVVFRDTLRHMACRLPAFCWAFGRGVRSHAYGSNELIQSSSVEAAETIVKLRNEPETAS